MGTDGKPLEGVPVPEEELRFIALQFIRSCLLAGLQLQDAEDLTQDVWLWLIQSDNLSMITLAPWMSAVLGNFRKRFAKRRHKDARMFRAVDPERPQRMPSREPSTEEARLFLDRLARRSPATERKLLQYLRAGYRLSEAAELLQIRHGSEQFHMNRIRVLARRLGKRPPGTRD